MEEFISYSNPRKSLEILDWPSGSHKTKATFTVESNKNGERAVRVTVNPKTGKENAAKKLTYARKVVFVDGSDGKLYILDLGFYSSHISVMKGTFDYQHETLFPDNPRYAQVLKLLTD